MNSGTMIMRITKARNSTSLQIALIVDQNSEKQIFARRAFTEQMGLLLTVLWRVTAVLESLNANILRTVSKRLKAKASR
jgi:hypothetical protein